MIYNFLCDDCAHEECFDPGYGMSIGDLTHYLCERCYGGLRRSASFCVQRPMIEHLNVTTGMPVSSEKQFKEQLKIKSDEATQRTGMDHKFVPCDVTDMKALGVTGDGIDESRRTRRAQGLDQPDSTRTYIT